MDFDATEQKRILREMERDLLAIVVVDTSTRSSIPVVTAEA